MSEATTWWERAECRFEDPETFYPLNEKNVHSREVKAAKEICSRCRVVEECLRAANAEESVPGVLAVGIRGALTGAERRTFWKGQRRRENKALAS